MELQVDVWLRGTDFAKTQTISGIGTDPAAWTDQDVSKLLKAMLLSIHRAKHPNSTDTPVFLRGFSWIVNPFEESGVVVAIEIQTGAAVAGPFPHRQETARRHDLARHRGSTRLVRDIDSLRIQKACLSDTEAHRHRGAPRLRASGARGIRKRLREPSIQKAPGFFFLSHAEHSRFHRAHRVIVFLVLECSLRLRASASTRQICRRSYGQLHLSLQHRRKKIAVARDRASDTTSMVNCSDVMPRSISSHVTGVETLATFVGRTEYTLASVRPHAFWL